MLELPHSFNNIFAEIGDGAAGGFDMTEVGWLSAIRYDDLAH